MKRKKFPLGFILFPYLKMYYRLIAIHFTYLGLWQYHLCFIYR